MLRVKVGTHPSFCILAASCTVTILALATTRELHGGPGSETTGWLVVPSKSNPLLSRGSPRARKDSNRIAPSQDTARAAGAVEGSALASAEAWDVVRREHPGDDATRPGSGV